MDIEQKLAHLEPLDQRQVEIWRRMSPAQKLELVFQAYQFALEMVRVTERQAHPDMPQEELNWHITRRMQGDPSLGRRDAGTRPRL
jgi:hypothetical protein